MIRRLRNSIGRLEDAADQHDATMAGLADVATNGIANVERCIDFAAADIRKAARAHAEAMDLLGTVAVAAYLVFAVYLVARHYREVNSAGT